MRNWRIISTIAAVVFAAIAGVLVWKYLTNADTRAEKNKHLVTVLVAKSQIARGTAVRPGAGRQAASRRSRSPRTRCRPNQHHPGHRRRSCSTSTRARSRPPTSSPAPRSSPTSSCSRSQLVSTVAGAIPKGKQAITVSLDQTHAVGGFVTPGDKVNVHPELPDHRRTKGSSTGHKAHARSCCRA